MTDKTKSQTFQKIIGQQDIKDILNQQNVTFKNNKGKNKQRHGGLTIKFSNDIEVMFTHILKNKINRFWGFYVICVSLFYKVTSSD